MFLCRFKFDDERVTKEDAKKALEEQYGGEEEVIYIANQRYHVTHLFFVQLFNIFFLFYFS